MAVTNRHHLLLCLGTGPLKNKKGEDVSPEAMLRTGEYRTARYAASGGSTVCETPFVGEALLRLHPDRFTHVHLFGTRDSMWDTLYLHLLGDGERPEEAVDRYLRMSAAVHDRDGARLEPGDADLQALRGLMAERFGARVSLTLLPLPDTEAATWEMLRCMASLDDLRSGDALSVDLTHGLRVQPVFLMLAARYLQAARERLRLEHVFYGAFDLRREGVTPIQDLRTHVALLDWVDAAVAFDRYGDAGPVADLLGGGRAAQLAAFAQKVQLNTARDIRTAAREVTRQYANLPDDLPVPFTLLADRLLDLPRRIEASEKPWEGRLLIAERHAEAQNLGLALMAAWEAVLDRIADVYDLTEAQRRDKDVAFRLMQVATARDKKVRELYDALPTFETRARLGLWKDWRGGARVSVPFGMMADAVNRLRNAVAHTTEDLGGFQFKPADVYRLADDGLFGYLRTCLQHEALEDLPRFFPTKLVKGG